MTEQPPNPRPLSYRDAGVDIDAGHRLVNRIKPLARRTRRAGVLEGLGGFGALFELPLDRYRQPVLVSGADGVGTKLKLALEMERCGTIGIDLVAMCANDIVIAGAEPLFFLDYYATGRLDVAAATEVITGIATGCELAGAALVGGETAEMPGLYDGADFDLAGFCVGIVEKSMIIDGSKVAKGDALIGLASSGPHANGYSLIRKILATSGAALSERLADVTLGEALLAPTRIYVKPLLDLMSRVTVKALAHITGGGLPENLPRVLPVGLAAHIDEASWRPPLVFDWLRHQGKVAPNEMYRTFNCGVGMVVAVAETDADTALAVLRASGEIAWVLGHVDAAVGPERVVIR